MLGSAKYGLAERSQIMMELWISNNLLQGGLDVCQDKVVSKGVTSKRHSLSPAAANITLCLEDTV